jgi:hypothetical protein
MHERRFLAAILFRAVVDAQADEDPDLAAQARRWLARDGADLAELLDISPERVTGWVGKLTPLPYEQLTFDV